MGTWTREWIRGPAIVAVTLAAWLAPERVMAQTSAKGPQPAPQQAAASKPGGAAPGTVAQPQPEAYSYNPEGRRDPFVSLVSRGLESASTGRRGEGLAGLSTAEIVVRGVLQTQGSYVAMVQGPDMKTYIVHANDRLLDGTVKSIGVQGLVIIQEVNDPLSLIKQREVRRGLRAMDEGK
jgi:Tfp pilus assembly protein PilP